VSRGPRLSPPPVWQHIPTQWNEHCDFFSALRTDPLAPRQPADCTTPYHHPWASQSAPSHSAPTFQCPPFFLPSPTVRNYRNLWVLPLKVAFDLRISESGPYVRDFSYFPPDPKPPRVPHYFNSTRLTPFHIIFFTISPPGLSTPVPTRSIPPRNKACRSIVVPMIEISGVLTLPPSEVFGTTGLELVDRAHELNYNVLD